mgnify:CR=1 FL=1
MGLMEEVLYKDVLQTSETCALLDMSRQNLYKMRKEGRIYRLIESHESRFYKDSVYQEWFQRHIKQFYLQVPLAPMETLTRLRHINTPSEDLIFDKQFVVPMLDVLLSNFGTSEKVVKIPYEYTMRFYHLMSDYLLDAMTTFSEATYINSRIETEIYAFIEHLKDIAPSDDDTFHEYIELFKTHCFKAGRSKPLAESFIEMTDVYHTNMIFKNYLTYYLNYFESFREVMVLTLMKVMQCIWSNIFIYSKHVNLRHNIPFFNQVSTGGRPLDAFIQQLLVLIYDVRGSLA